jgi:hypothetical protein
MRAQLISHRGHLPRGLDDKSGPYRRTKTPTFGRVKSIGLKPLSEFGRTSSSSARKKPGSGETNRVLAQWEPDEELLPYGWPKVATQINDMQPQAIRPQARASVVPWVWPASTADDAAQRGADLCPPPPPPLTTEPQGRQLPPPPPARNRTHTRSIAAGSAADGLVGVQGRSRTHPYLPVKHIKHNAFARCSTHRLKVWNPFCSP